MLERFFCRNLWRQTLISLNLEKTPTLSSILSVQVRWIRKTNGSGWETSAVSVSNNDQFFVKSVYLWRPAKVNKKSIIWKQGDVKPYILLLSAVPCWPNCGLHLHGGREGLFVTEESRLCAPASSAQCWSRRLVLPLYLHCWQQALVQRRLRSVSFGERCWPECMPNWICLPSVSSPVHGAADRESHLCYSLFILAWGEKWNRAITLLAVWYHKAV